MRAFTTALVVVLVSACGAEGARAQEAPCAACLAVSVTPAQAPGLPENLGRLDVLIRVAAGDEAAALAGLGEIARKGGNAGLAIEGVPLGALSPALMTRIARMLIDLGEVSPAADMEQLAYVVKLRLTAARAQAPRGIALGIAAPPAVISALLARDLGPYVDFMVWNGPPAPERRGHEVWRPLTSAPEEPGSVATALLAARAAGVDRWLWRMPADQGRAAALIGDLARALELLPRGLVPSATTRIACGGVSAGAYLNPQTLETVALARACPPDAAVTVMPPAPGVERVALATGDAIVRVPAPGAQERFAEGVQVVGSRELAVEEIVARHQAAAARQAAAVRDLISRGTLTLSFEAPGFPAPVVISSEAVIYVAAGVTELEQRAMRVNGIAFKGGSVPRLPIIEPERVASPPLAITLTGVYRYRLAGREHAGGTLCYVVAFEPIDGAALLFRGRAWIAADSFAMVKAAAVQTGLRGPIVASEQVDEFREAQEGVWLLARSDVRQMYEGAAHRTPIHRVLAIATHEINPPDFLVRRQAAYASDAVMLRDTPQGYRYLRRERGSGGAAAAPEPAVAGRANRVRTLVAGVLIDPNISVPLPFAGMSYVDFNLFGTGTQLNAFFGGTYGQLAFAVPSLGRSRWQLAGRAFGIASSYNDRSFVNGRERHDENVRQRPAQAAVWLLRSLTPRISIRIGYDLDYTHLAAGDSTAPAFAVPADQIVHGARVALDAQRDGWNGSVWWNPARRSGWRAWGFAGSGEYDPAHDDFQRYGVSVVRSAVLAPRLAGRVEGSWMSGRDLDRFSRYSFGTFDNRLRGYPSALIRYDRGAVLRTAVAWAAGSLLRVDGFFDTASVRDPGFGRRMRNYTGVGGALEAPAPFGTLVAVEWGYGFRGINGDGSRGTQVVRVSGFKVF
jgi:hypothetical protein